MQKITPFNDLLDRYKQDLMKTYKSRQQDEYKPLSRHFDTEDTYKKISGSEHQREVNVHQSNNDLANKMPKNPQSYTVNSEPIPERTAKNIQVSDTVNYSNVQNDASQPHETINTSGFPDKNSKAMYDVSEMNYEMMYSKKNPMSDIPINSKSYHDAVNMNYEMMRNEKNGNTSGYSKAYYDAEAMAQQIQDISHRTDSQIFKGKQNIYSSPMYQNALKLEQEAGKNISDGDMLKNSKAYFDVIDMNDEAENNLNPLRSKINTTERRSMLESMQQNQYGIFRGEFPESIPAMAEESPAELQNPNRSNNIPVQSEQEPDYDNGNFGFLQINATTSEGTVPISGAHVTVFTEENGTRRLIKLMTTDRNGATPAIPLEAPSQVYSLTPSNGVKPYSEYNVFVSAEGFRPIENINVPIFSTIKSVLPINMIPLLEYETNRESIIEYVGEEPNL